MMKNTETRAFNTKGPLGLMMLLLNRSLFEAIDKWTVPVIRRRDHCRTFPMHDLYAYVGLEIAVSLNRVASFEDMWNTKKFAGVEDFRALIGRDKFKRIRPALRFYPSCDHDVATKDSLRHNRLILQLFCRN